VALPPAVKSIDEHGSIAHVALHPSPSAVLPSSQVSPVPTRPSPQRTVQVPVWQL
jgi:hypothetical protein